MTQLPVCNKFFGLINWVTVKFLPYIRWVVSPFFPFRRKEKIHFYLLTTLAAQGNTFERKHLLDFWPDSFVICKSDAVIKKIRICSTIWMGNYRCFKWRWFARGTPLISTIIMWKSWKHVTGLNAISFSLKKCSVYMLINLIMCATFY